MCLAIRQTIHANARPANPRVYRGTKTMWICAATVGNNGTFKETG
jgi:hypothetical protein